MTADGATGGIAEVTLPLLVHLNRLHHIQIPVLDIIRLSHDRERETSVPLHDARKP